MNKEEAENKRIAEIIVESELALLANYIVSEIPGEPLQSEGVGHTAIRLLKTYRVALAAIASDLAGIGDGSNELSLTIYDLLGKEE